MKKKGGWCQKGIRKKKILLMNNAKICGKIV